MLTVQADNAAKDKERRAKKRGASSTVVREGEEPKATEEPATKKQVTSSAGAEARRDLSTSFSQEEEDEDSEEGEHDVACVHMNEGCVYLTRCVKDGKEYKMITFSKMPLFIVKHGAVDSTKLSEIDDTCFELNRKDKYKLPLKKATKNKPQPVFEFMFQVPKNLGTWAFTNTFAKNVDQKRFVTALRKSVDSYLAIHP